MKFPKEKKVKVRKMSTLLNKIHKANKKLCFFFKKPKHFVKNYLKKKNDEKEKENQACEDQEQTFVATNESLTKTRISPTSNLATNIPITYHYNISNPMTQLTLILYGCFVPR